MYKINFFVALLVFSFVSQCCLAHSSSQPEFRTRLNLSRSSNSSQEVADRANRMYGESNAGFIQDPLMNGALGGYYNMMQGMSGSSPVNMQEIQKQQADYVKQQMSNTEAE